MIERVVNIKSCDFEKEESPKERRTNFSFVYFCLFLKVLISFSARADSMLCVSRMGLLVAQLNVAGF